MTSRFVKPVAVQLVPLLVERKTPLSVPAKRFEPLTVRAETFVFVRPLLTAVQLVPLLVERKTPPPQVPAKRFVPLAARAETFIFVKPLLTVVRFPPTVFEASLAVLPEIIAE